MSRPAWTRAEQPRVAPGLEQVAAAVKASEAAGRQLAAGRSENAEALKKARADVTDKQNKLKAISKALADTPENVVKKLKTLKKQKLEESKLRTQTESRLLATRKEKTKLEAEVEQRKSLIEQAAPLIDQLKELHAIAKKQNKKIKSLSEDKKDVVKIPKLDEELVEAIEKAISEK